MMKSTLWQNIVDLILNYPLLPIVLGFAFLYSASFSRRSLKRALEHSKQQVHEVQERIDPVKKRLVAAGHADQDVQKILEEHFATEIHYLKRLNKYIAERSSWVGKIKDAALVIGKICVGWALIGGPLVYNLFVGGDHGLEAFGLGLSILILIFVSSSHLQEIERKLDRLTEQNHNLAEAIIDLSRRLQHLGEHGDA
jgi:hypothetical protein